MFRAARTGVAMYARIANLMSWRAGLLMAGCAEALSREHLYPCAIYIGDRLHAVSTGPELVTIYRDIHAALLRLGARRLEAKVMAVGLPRAGRFRVWVDWRAEMQDNQWRRVAQTVEYMRETEQGSRSEMTEWCGWAPRVAIAAR